MSRTGELSRVGRRLGRKFASKKSCFVDTKSLAFRIYGNTLVSMKPKLSQEEENRIQVIVDDVENLVESVKQRGMRGRDVEEWLELVTQLRRAVDGLAALPVGDWS